MPEDNESKLNKILSELPRVKRIILEDHLNTLSGEERDKFVEEVIAEYEAVKKKASEGMIKPVETINEESKEPEVKEEAKEEIKEVSIDEIDTESEPVPEETPDLESNIIQALKTGEPEDKDTKPVFPSVKHDTSEDRSREFTIDPIHTKRPGKNRLPAVILAIVGVIAAGALVYIFALSKNPEFYAFTSRLGIPGPAAVTEAPATQETQSETTALPTNTPTPTPTPEPTATPTPTEIPTPTPIVPKSDAPDLKGIKVVIDPGHQEKTDYKKEKFKNGTSTGKPRCTSGAVGVATGQKEYEFTLEMALMLKDYLEQCGATVILTRTENDVNISNQERAAIAVKNKPTMFLRLHADAMGDSKIKGVRVYIPSSGKLNTGANANKLGKLVANAAGTTYRGAKKTNQYTGLNFAYTLRSYQIVLGYLSNAEDDKRLADPDNRYEMCAAIATFCSTFKKK